MLLKVERLKLVEERWGMEECAGGGGGGVKNCEVGATQVFCAGKML